MRPNQSRPWPKLWSMEPMKPEIRHQHAYELNLPLRLDLKISTQKKNFRHKTCFVTSFDAFFLLRKWYFGTKFLFSTEFFFDNFLPNFYIQLKYFFWQFFYRIFIFDWNIFLTKFLFSTEFFFFDNFFTEFLYSTEIFFWQFFLTKFVFSTEFFFFWQNFYLRLKFFVDKIFIFNWNVYFKLIFLHFFTKF